MKNKFTKEELRIINDELRPSDIEDIIALIMEKYEEVKALRKYELDLEQLSNFMGNCNGVEEVEFVNINSTLNYDKIIYNYRLKSGKIKKDIRIDIGESEIGSVNYYLNHSYNKRFKSIEDFIKMLPKLHQAIEDGVI